MDISTDKLKIGRGPNVTTSSLVMQVSKAVYPEKVILDTPLAWITLDAGWWYDIYGMRFVLFVSSANACK